MCTLDEESFIDVICKVLLSSFQIVITGILDSLVSITRQQNLNHALTSMIFPHAYKAEKRACESNER